MNKHTIGDLRQMQSLPLSAKIRMTQNRVNGWYDNFDGQVYVSFSGGKDSAVLLDLVRNEFGFKDVPAMFVDVPTQYPELRSFVKTFDNVDIVQPKINFFQVCEKYGFPLFSKEICENVKGAKRYWQEIKRDKSLGIKSLEDREKIAELLNARIKGRMGGSNQRLAIMLGMYTKDKQNLIKAFPSDDEKSNFDYEAFSFLLEAPFDISNKCCDAMKKEPSKRYSKETGRAPITAQMASESRLRTSIWLRQGCNAFDNNNPISNPMSFWLEQDVLKYIKDRDLEICSVYGKVVEFSDEDVKGQMSLECVKNQSSLKCTGCSRTGCVLCGYGTHIAGEDMYRFIRLKETHPQMYKLLDVVQNNGYTMRQAIDWIMEHSNKVIRY